MSPRTLENVFLSKTDTVPGLEVSGSLFIL